MKLVAISDTHRLHHKLEIPPCDVLVHAGDFSNRGSLFEAADFLTWFSRQLAPHKVLVCGNHDKIMEKEARAMRVLTEGLGITMLTHQAIKLYGYKFYGTPYTPRFGCDWAFQTKRSPKAAKKVWGQIHQNTDILITHGPPKGILDRNIEGHSCGCPVLTEQVLMRVKPKLHIFGHIHESRGYKKVDQTEFYNVASRERLRDEVRPPTVIELENLNV